jgi:hypothetical protein
MMNDPRFFTPPALANASMIATDRSSIQAKTARLAAAKERQQALRRHGAAAAILMELSQHRACLLCRALLRWRLLPHATIMNGTARSSHGSGSLDLAARPSDCSSSGRAGEVAALQAELATLRDENARLSAQAASYAASDARTGAERRLLRRELEDEWRGRLEAVQSEAQSAMVRHLYEKQELKAAHHKALQRADFDRLDLLAQQEARSKVRESQLYGQVLKQVQRLKTQLSERTEGSEELVRLLHAQQEAEEQLQTLRERVRTAEGAGIGAPSPSRTPPRPASCRKDAALSENLVPQRSPARAPLFSDVGPGAPSSARGSPRATLGGGAPASPHRPRSQPAASPAASTAAEAAAEEVAALREQLLKADEQQAEARRCHAREISKCDEQSAKLRDALSAIEERLEQTEGALRIAKEAATKAEGAKALALVEQAEGQQEAASLRHMLCNANARLSSVSVGECELLFPPSERETAPKAVAAADPAQGLPSAPTPSVTSGVGARVDLHAGPTSSVANSGGGGGSTAVPRSHPFIPTLPL